MKFADIPIRDFGHTIQIGGMILRGNGQEYHVRFPDEPLDHEQEHDLEMSLDDWEKFIYQSDMLEVEMSSPLKAIVRKSQRQIDVSVSWAVFKRDGYKCRYCGKEKPLTVDHVVLWEDGGPSVEANLIAACKTCNRTRGNTPYPQWLESEYYRKVAKDGPYRRLLNESVLKELPRLETMKVQVQRSR